MRQEALNRQSSTGRVAAGNVLAWLGASFILDSVRFSTTNSLINSVTDAGGGVITFSSAAGKEFNSVITGPFGGITPSLRTNNTTGRLFSATGGITGANKAFHTIILGEILAPAASGAGVDSCFVWGAPAAALNLSFGSDTLKRWRFFDDVGATNIHIDANLIWYELTSSGFPFILEVQYDGTTLSIWVNGQHFPLHDAAKSYNVSDVSFGFGNWYTGGGYYVADCRIDGAMFAAGKVISRPLIHQFLRYEMRRLGATGRIVAFFGDSTTAGGATGTHAQYYTPYAVRALQTGANVIYPQNNALSGLTSTQILAQLITPYADPSTHAVVWMGVNDVAGSVAAANIYANVVTAVNILHARGIKVVVGTLAQWGALVNDATKDAIRIAYNALIVANTAGADAIADISTAMGAYNSANFCVDTLHPNDTAQSTIIAPVIYNVLITI